MEQSPSSVTDGMPINAEVLAAALGVAEESIVITDAQLDNPGPTILYVNAAFTQMTGYTAEEAIG